MPTTSFRLLPARDPLDIDLKAFQSMLPSIMSVVPREGATYIDVETSKDEDECAQFLVDRELDRVFFLTSVRVKSEMCRRTVSSEQRFAWSIHAPIPPGTTVQTWNYELGLQLRLWSLACETDDPLTKIVLFYQIIELSCPPRDQYEDPSRPPKPLTECKLLRNLIVHAGNVTFPETKNYCEYLGMPELMCDRTDRSYVELLAAKQGFVESQAQGVIQRALRA